MLKKNVREDMAEVRREVEGKKNVTDPPRHRVEERGKRVVRLLKLNLLLKKERSKKCKSILIGLKNQSQRNQDSKIDEKLTSSSRA